jgi:hypothetical protein
MRGEAVGLKLGMPGEQRGRRSLRANFKCEPGAGESCGARDFFKAPRRRDDANDGEGFGDALVERLVDRAFHAVGEIGIDAVEFEGRAGRRADTQRVDTLQSGVKAPPRKFGRVFGHEEEVKGSLLFAVNCPADPS